MAKRVPKDDKPYRPLDESLIRSVISGPPAGQGGAQAAAVAPEPAHDPRPMHAAEPAAPRSSPRLVPAPEHEPSQPRRPASVTDALPEKREREKRMLLTRSEEREVEHLVNRLAQELGTAVKLSHVLRACTLILVHAEDDLLDRARKTPVMARPGNGNASELAEFEKSLAQILLGGLRDAPALR